MPRIRDRDGDRNARSFAASEPPSAGSQPYDRVFVPPPEPSQPADRASSPPSPPPELGALPPPPPPGPARSERAKHGKHAIRSRPKRFGRIVQAFSDRPWLRIAGIVLLSVAAGTAGFFLLLALLGGEEGDASPEDTVLSLFEAAKSEDCETAVELVTEDFWSAEGSSDPLEVCQGFVESETPGWVDNYTVKEVMLRSEEADTATVGVRLSPEAGADIPPEWLASVVSQDDGTWLVETVEVTDLSEAGSTGEGTQGSGDAAGSASGAPGKPEPPPTGGGPDLDRLAVSCYQGDMVACDDLFGATYDEAQEYGTTSRPHTEYGATCGGRFTGEVRDYCVDLIPDSNG